MVGLNRKVRVSIVYTKQCVLLLTTFHMHTVRNPAYGMSVIQAPNDAGNVQSNDEHTYEDVRGKGA